MMFIQISQEMNEECGFNINFFFCVVVFVIFFMFVCDVLGNYVGFYVGINVNLFCDICIDYNCSCMICMFFIGYVLVDIIKGLKLKEILSYDYIVQKDFCYLNLFSGVGFKSGSDVQILKGFIEYGKLLLFILFNYIYIFVVKYYFDILVVYELESYQSDKVMGEKVKFFLDVLFELDNVVVLKSFVFFIQVYRMIFYLFCLNYDYDNCYYIVGSYCCDGSLCFVLESWWGDFWFVFGMWYLSSEFFMEVVKLVLNDVKICVFYGVNGNQLGVFYGYMGLYSYGQNYMGVVGLYEFV